MAFTDNTTGGRVVRQGILPIKLTITDSCLAGDLIGYDSVSSEAWERADANAKVYASFIAGEDGASGDVITCYRQAYVSGFTGSAAGKLVYLADTVGQYVGDPDGNYQQCVGICVSDTEALIRPDCVPVMGYSSEADSTGLGVAGFFRAELKDGTGAAHFGGVKIETKTVSTADTVPSVRSLYIYHQADVDATPGEDNVIVRLEDGGVAPANAYLELACTSGAGPSYLFYIYQGTATATRLLGTASTQSGWLKVRVGGPGGGDRYIALYTTVS